MAEQLSELERQARTFMNFKAMGDNWTDEKARAHAEITDEQWPVVQAEIERLRTTPEERATKQLEQRFQGLEAALRVLQMQIDSVALTQLPAWLSDVPERLKALEDTLASQPRSKSSRPKARKPLNLSPEERQRRREQGKKLAAMRHKKPKPTTNDDDDWTPVTS